ncbi:T-cell surface glycoprotein CD8 alpha chain [Dirofilaria immitis]
MIVSREKRNDRCCIPSGLKHCDENNSYLLCLNQFTEYTVGYLGCSRNDIVYLTRQDVSPDGTMTNSLTITPKGRVCWKPGTSNDLTKENYIDLGGKS